MASSVPPLNFLPEPEPETVGPTTQKSPEKSAVLTFIESYKASAGQIRIEIKGAVGNDMNFEDEEDEESERFLDEDILRRLVCLDSSRPDDFLNAIDTVFAQDEQAKKLKKDRK